MNGEQESIFIEIEIDGPAASDPELAKKLEEVCPVSPKAIQTEDVEVKDVFGEIVLLNKPFMVPDLCIGCGICQAECPVKDDRAVYVTAVGESRSEERRLLLKDRSRA